MVFAPRGCSLWKCSRTSHRFVTHNPDSRSVRPSRAAQIARKAAMSRGSATPVRAWPVLASRPVTNPSYSPYVTAIDTLRINNI